MTTGIMWFAYQCHVINILVLLKSNCPTCEDEGAKMRKIFFNFFFLDVHNILSLVVTN